MNNYIWLIARGYVIDQFVTGGSFLHPLVLLHGHRCKPPLTSQGPITTLTLREANMAMENPFFIDFFFIKTLYDDHTRKDAIFKIRVNDIISSLVNIFLIFSWHIIICHIPPNWHTVSNKLINQDQPKSNQPTFLRQLQRLRGPSSFLSHRGWARLRVLHGGYPGWHLQRPSPRQPVQRSGAGLPVDNGYNFESNKQATDAIGYYVLFKSIKQT